MATLVLRNLQFGQRLSTIDLTPLRSALAGVGISWLHVWQTMLGRAKKKSQGLENQGARTSRVLWLFFFFPSPCDLCTSVASGKLDLRVAQNSQGICFQRKQASNKLHLLPWWGSQKRNSGCILFVRTESSRASSCSRGKEPESTFSPIIFMYQNLFNHYQTLAHI